MKKILLFLALIVWVNAFTFSQETNTQLLKLDFPLFDLPYQINAMDAAGHSFFGSYANPSMTQSMAISTDMFSAFHYGMRIFHDKSKMNIILKNIIYYSGTVLGDIAIGKLPFGGITWMHEEYHRAVMSRYKVNSFNTAYILKKKVNHVSDEDFVRFKKESPIDFIRMQEAGIEGEYLLVNTLQENNFFYNKNYFSEFIYWINIIDGHTYIWNIGDVTADQAKNETTMAERDFTGMDPLAWVYDLFRPNESYTERGIHPTGIGIDRYRHWDNLTKQEKDYFVKIRYWQFANYISPMMFGFKSLPWGKTDIRWNFAFRHFLTSFGTDLSLKVFFNINTFNLTATYHNYQNYEHIFPAIEIGMIDYPVRIGNFNMFLSPKIMIGTQPKEQYFFTSESEFFGLINIRIDFQINMNLFPYFEVSAKTNGWVAGNEYLEKNTKIIIGISTRFY